MGTVNYGTSDYITLGVRPYDMVDFESDPDLIEELRWRVNEYGGTLENELRDYIQECYADDHSNIDSLLREWDFYYFDIELKYGYYEGFYLDIKKNYGVAFDTWEDKRAAQKEITGIGQFMRDCAGMGLVRCSPGWCTGYSDYKGTIEAIRGAVKAMREEVKTTPTWNRYTRNQAAPFQSGF